MLSCFQSAALIDADVQRFSLALTPINTAVDRAVTLPIRIVIVNPLTNAKARKVQKHTFSTYNNLE
jgi:hypothetical protein